VRHTRRNPQKSPAEPFPDPERIVKAKKASQKGALGSGKPKKSHSFLKDKVVVEELQSENLEPCIVNHEIPSDINSAPYTVSFPLNLSPKKASHTVHNIPVFPTIQSASIFPYIPIMAGQQAPTRIERIVAAR